MTSPHYIVVARLFYSTAEAARLIASACSPKYRAALSVAYGAGLRASEVVGLKVTDVDSGRMVLRVEQAGIANEEGALPNDDT